MVERIEIKGHDVGMHCFLSLFFSSYYKEGGDTPLLSIYHTSILGGIKWINTRPKGGCVLFMLNVSTCNLTNFNLQLAIILH